jgi:sulfate adenylyltransferase subunit 2
MRTKSPSPKAPAERVLKDIRRATRKHYSAEDKIRIVLDGLRGEDSIAELCRREGIAQSMYYVWSKEFLEAGKRRLAGDTARAAGINPFDHGDRYTLVMRTEPLKTALDAGGYDIIFGGARRDEEKSRAKERIVSVRGTGHTWEPRQQRPELWRLYNTQLGESQTARVFPLSNWTETDILAYALLHEIDLAPLYFAAPRPVVQRAGAFIVIDEESRMRFQPGDRIQIKTVRFRTLGCWPVTGAVESNASDLDAVVYETLQASSSERQGRISDDEDGGSLEQKKREGYF